MNSAIGLLMCFLCKILLFSGVVSIEFFVMSFQYIEVKHIAVFQYSVRGRGASQRRISLILYEVFFSLHRVLYLRLCLVFLPPLCLSVASLSVILLRVRPVAWGYECTVFGYKCYMVMFTQFSTFYP